MLISCGQVPYVVFIYYAMNMMLMLLVVELMAMYTRCGIIYVCLQGTYEWPMFCWNVV